MPASSERIGCIRRWLNLLVSFFTFQRFEGELSTHPEVVTAWLTGKRLFLLDRSEQDLDTILECTFSIQQLINFYDTPHSVRDRWSVVAAALWRSVELIEENDFDAQDPIPDPREISKLMSFMSARIDEFRSLGFGHNPNCPVVTYIKAWQEDAKPPSSQAGDAL